MRTHAPLILALTSAVVRLILASPNECVAAQQMTCPIVDCDDSDVAQEGRVAIFRGVYTLSFEKSEFVPAGSGCRWWLAGETQQLWVATHSPQGMESATVRIEVQGIVSKPGCYGHLGIYRRELTVTRILSAEVRGREVDKWTPLSLPILPTPTVPGPLPPEKLRR